MTRTRAVDIVERVVWTFVQAFVGSLPATVPLTREALSAVGYSALAAGIAAVLSLAKNLSLTPPATLLTAERVGPAAVWPSYVQSASGAFVPVQTGTGPGEPGPP